MEEKERKKVRRRWKGRKKEKRERFKWKKR